MEKLIVCFTSMIIIALWINIYRRQALTFTFSHFLYFCCLKFINWSRNESAYG